MSSRAQIVVTVGPSGEVPGVLAEMAKAGMDVARFNVEWFDPATDGYRIDAVREAAPSAKIIADLPGPRVQLAEGHTYDPSKTRELSETDRRMLDVCVHKGVEYIAVSFVASSDDIERHRQAIAAAGGNQKIIAKLERKAALEHLESIIAASDAVMVARGDLGKEIPIEEIPSVEKTIIERANRAGKPVIVATGLLLSMTEHTEPTRAEVTDVETAILLGADATMLSEETASGKHPALAVATMERLLSEAEKHRPNRDFHLL